MTTAMPLRKTSNQSSLPPMMVGNPQKSVNYSWEAGTPRSHIPPVNLPSVGHDPRPAAGGSREDFGSTRSYLPVTFLLNINQLPASREDGRIISKFLRKSPSPFNLPQTGWQP